MKVGNVKHPLRRSEPVPMTEFALSEAMRLPGDSAVMRYHVTDDQIDQIAADVRRLPSTLTASQKERLSIIARELRRLVAK